MAQHTPYDAYAQHLSPSGHGYPLWFPEGSELDPEVEIGDVGYFQWGAFRPLFNVSKTYEDDSRSIHHCKRLKFDNTYELFPFDDDGRPPDDVRPRYLEQGLHTNRGMEAVELDTEVQLDAMNAAGTQFCYGYKSLTSGISMCYLPEGARLHILGQSNQLIRYIKRNHDKWLETLGISMQLKPEDLIFVRGHVKTNRCVLATYSTTIKGHDVQAALKGGFVAVGGGLSMDFKTLRGDSLQPTTRHTDPQHDDTKWDQCIFLRFYRLRYRLPFRWAGKLEAQAGPHELPDGSDPDLSPEVVTFNDEYDEGIEPDSANSSRQAAFEPTDALLDYILSNSQADCAIACDDDIEAFYLGDARPPDLRAFLETKRPRVVVDDKNVGSLDLEEIVRRQRIWEFSGKAPDDFLGRPENDGDEGPEGSGDEAVLKDDVMVLGTDTPERSFNWPHLYMWDKITETGTLRASVVSPDGKYLAAGYDDPRIRIWNIETGQLDRTLDGHEEPVWSLAFSPNGSILVSGASDCKILVWRMTHRGADVIAALDGHELDVVSLVFSPDGRRIASGCNGGTFKIWDAQQYTKLVSLEGQTASAMQLAFTPDSSKLITCSGNTGYIWDAASGQELARMVGHDGAIWSISLSSDGTRVVTGSDDQTARVWDANTGVELVILREHSGPVWCVAFSPDGSEIASGSHDASVVTCDSYSGQRHHHFAQRPTLVNSIAYSHNGRFICTGSIDGNVRLLDAKTGEFIAEYQGHSDQIKHTCFTPNNDFIVSSSEDGTVRKFSVHDALRLL